MDVIKEHEEEWKQEMMDWKQEMMQEIRNELKILEGIITSGQEATTNELKDFKNYYKHLSENLLNILEKDLSISYF